MPVYVDKLKEYPEGLVPGAPRAKYWCHMWADSTSELLTMAKTIGLKMEWLQIANEPRPRNSYVPNVHYDLTTPNRVRAVKAGCVEMDFKEWLKAKRSEGQI